MEGAARVKPKAGPTEVEPRRQRTTRVTKAEPDVETGAQKTGAEPVGVRTVVESERRKSPVELKGRRDEE